MNSITISEQNKVLVVDSRLIAEELGIKHKSFSKTIERYESLIETNFGKLNREVLTKQSPSGIKNPNPEYFYWLTEDQATFLMTLSRNSDPVVQCKVNLVKAFSEAKKKLQQPIEPKSQPKIEDLTQRQTRTLLLIAIMREAYDTKFEGDHWLNGIDPVFWNMPVLAVENLIDRQNLADAEFLQDLQSQYIKARLGTTHPAACRSDLNSIASGLRDERARVNETKKRKAFEEFVSKLEIFNNLGNGSEYVNSFLAESLTTLEVDISQNLK